MPQHMSYNEHLRSFLYLCSLISSNKPALVTRASGIEGSVLEFALRKRNANGSSLDRHIIQRNLDDCIKRLANNAGILVTNNQSLDVFVDSNITANLDSDALLVWDGGMGEQFQYCLDYLMDRKPELPVFAAHGLEPYYFFDVPSYAERNPYKNRTILIIASHIESMRRQVYSGNYSRCFSPHTIFDNCRFKFVKPPQTLAGNHGNRDWQLNLPRFIHDIKSVGDFDIALVSCGGYGTPTVDYIHKKFNRHAVYIGGALQLFFGIIGERWRENGTIMSFYQKNSGSWITPLSADIPRNSGRVENGCYW